MDTTKADEPLPANVEKIIKNDAPPQWIETRVTLTAVTSETLLDLVANCFLELGLQGVVVEEPHLPIPAADEMSASVKAPLDYAVIGYFRDDTTFDTRRRQLESALARVLTRFAPASAETSYQRIEEEEWHRSWQSFFKPLYIGKRLVIKPSWCDDSSAKGRKLLTLDPGMAFGTGSHPTTMMCLEMIEKLIQPGHALLDVGTGTGVLLIAAALWGAARGHGIDIDPTAVAIARQNLALNEINSAAFTVSEGDVVTPPWEGFAGYDLVVANILAGTIMELLPAIPGLLRPGGSFIASGFLLSDEKRIEAKLHRFGLVIVDRRQQEEWLCLAAQKGT